MLVAGKTAHIGAQLGDDGGGGGFSNSRQGLRQRHRLPKRGQTLLNLRFEFGDGLFKKVDVS